MIKSEASVLRVVIYEGDESQPWQSELRFEVFRALLIKGYCVTYACEIYPVVATPMLVLGLFQNSTPPKVTTENDQPMIFRDIHNLVSQEIVQLVDDVTEKLRTRKPGDWKAWFPVIDYDRCTNCMQCLNFCLFNVYAISEEGEILIRNHEKCKTDCPACSRVCPEVAIIFPKYSSGPINGAEINDVEQEKTKVDVSNLLGGNIYQMLRDRSQSSRSRFSKERDEQQAFKERQRYLLNLKDQLDIPDHVLKSLPTLDQTE